MRLTETFRRPNWFACLAPSVTVWAHKAFLELRADRSYHQPGDDSPPDPSRSAHPLGRAGRRRDRPRTATYDAGVQEAEIDRGAFGKSRLHPLTCVRTLLPGVRGVRERKSRNRR